MLVYIIDFYDVHAVKSYLVFELTKYASINMSLDCINWNFIVFRARLEFLGQT